jgi:hypothetical protein
MCMYTGVSSRRDAAIDLHIYVCACVCVCLCVRVYMYCTYRERERERERAGVRDLRTGVSRHRNKKNLKKNVYIKTYAQVFPDAEIPRYIYMCVCVCVCCVQRERERERERESDRCTCVCTQVSLDSKMARKILSKAYNRLSDLAHQLLSRYT